MTQLEKWFEDLKSISPDQKDDYMENVVCLQIRQQTEQEARAQLTELTNSLRKLRDDLASRKTVNA
jgi:uncharacterized protein YeaC (DUF1315 family)